MRRARLGGMDRPRVIGAATFALLAVACGTGPAPRQPAPKLATAAPMNDSAPVAPAAPRPEPPKVAEPAAPSSDGGANDAAAPSVFDVRNASASYGFRFEMRDGCAGLGTATCAGPAELSVYTLASGAEVQRIQLEQAWVELEPNGTPSVNATELYGRQGTINVGDFDFDGHEDFAVQADQDGPYGGPTFRVFLYSPKLQRFALSEPLSKLTQETLGFFQVDAKRKRLITLSKSGCCYHTTAEYQVSGGSPEAVFRLIEDATGGTDMTEVTEHKVHGRWVKTTRHRPLPP